MDSQKEKYVAIDQIVALNMRHWRKAAGMTQDELGKLIGWSSANISAAERSAEEGRDLRRFNAHSLIAIAHALGMPVTALFLPPEDDGHGTRYLYRVREDSRPMDMEHLMRHVIPDNAEQNPLMDAYRNRLLAAFTRYFDKDWARLMARWLHPLDDREARRERAARLRARQAELLAAASQQAALLGAASEFGALADAIDESGDVPRHVPAGTGTATAGYLHAIAGGEADPS